MNLHGAERQMFYNNSGGSEMAFAQSEVYQPVESEEYMNDRQLQYFQKRLLRWRQELEASAANILHVLKETSFRNPDSLEISSTIIDVTLDITERDRQRKLIEQIDAALARIETGDYGYCHISGDEIGLKRLLAHPVATLCVELQEQLERISRSSSKRPPIFCQR